MKHIRHGFTLIELLVVVAIIVSLLAILMPSMGRAIEASNRAVCGSQIKQLTLASLTFAADHFGSLPDVERYELHWTTKNGIDLFVKPYVVDVAVTSCPNFLKGNTLADGVVNAGSSTGGAALFGYFYMGHKPTATLAPIAGFPTSADWVSPTSVSRPGSGVLWCDRQVTTVTGPYRSAFTHTAGGWSEPPLNTTAEEAGCEGTNRGGIDASVTWVSQPSLRPHANPSNQGVAWW